MHNEPRTTTSNSSCRRTLYPSLNRQLFSISSFVHRYIYIYPAIYTYIPFDGFTRNITARLPTLPHAFAPHSTTPTITILYTYINLACSSIHPTPNDLAGDKILLDNLPTFNVPYNPLPSPSLFHLSLSHILNLFRCHPHFFYIHVYNNFPTCHPISRANARSISIHDSMYNCSYNTLFII